MSDSYSAIPVVLTRDIICDISTCNWIRRTSRTEYLLIQVVKSVFKESGTIFTLAASLSLIRLV